MHQIRLIEAAGSTLADPETAAAEIRAAARLLEERHGLAPVLEAVVDPSLLAARIGGRSDAEARAWSTLAAAGVGRSGRCLAWRAGRALDVEDLAEAIAMPRNPRRACRRRAGKTRDPEERAAWHLLASLRVTELRRLAAAHPVVGARRIRRAGGAGGGRAAARAAG
ncbi:MAG: hypothetical protein JSS68_01895 [Actinobacteria bacterium]|nr:hypothetical protein [Actinomycetota bacterium]